MGGENWGENREEVLAEMENRLKQKGGLSPWRVGRVPEAGGDGGVSRFDVTGKSQASVLKDNVGSDADERHVVLRRAGINGFHYNCPGTLEEVKSSVDEQLVVEGWKLYK